MKAWKIRQSMGSNYKIKISILIVLLRESCLVDWLVVLTLLILCPTLFYSQFYNSFQCFLQGDLYLHYLVQVCISCHSVRCDHVIKIRFQLLGKTLRYQFCFLDTFIVIFRRISVVSVGLNLLQASHALCVILVYLMSPEQGLALVCSQLLGVSILITQVHRDKHQLSL